MTKQEIITYAESLGFHLGYDQFEVEDKEWMRFELPEDVDEPDLRWIWWKDKSDEDNISMGLHIKGRAKRKREIQEFLKY